MKSMGFNFIKRAVIVPLILTALVLLSIVAVAKLAPKMQEEPQNDVVYQKVEFSGFKTLSEGDYIGKLTIGKDFSADVTFGESVYGSLTLDTDSKEPWKKGKTVVIGTGANNQLGVLRNAKTGDTVTLEVFSNDKYKYVIGDIQYGMSLNEAKKVKGDLLICRSYNDFSDPGAAKLYIVYSANLAQEVNNG